jgi:hypothetical protein
LLFGILVPALATAQSAFDGTWKIDVGNAKFSPKPDVYLLQNGMYQCKTCVPPVDIKADGQDQKVTGHPYYDTAAIKVVNDHEIQETDKKGGKVVSTSTTTVSPDGNTLTFEFSDSSAKGPAGANAISGSWRTTKMENISDNAVTFTFKLTGDEVTMNSPTGQSYTAKLNGPDAPYRLNGKVIYVNKMTVAADGKTMSMVSDDKLHGRTSHFVATKQ